VYFLDLFKYKFAHRRNRLSTHFSECIPVVRRRISVMYPCFIQLNISLSHSLHLELASYVFNQRSLVNIWHAFFMSPMRATCLAHFFLLKFIALIIRGENTKNDASDYVILYIFYLLLGMLKLGVNKFRSLKIPALNDNINTPS
jgi:hypothetical protein